MKMGLVVPFNPTNGSGLTKWLRVYYLHQLKVESGEFVPNTYRLPSQFVIFGLTVPDKFYFRCLIELSQNRDKTRQPI